MEKGTLFQITHIPNILKYYYEHLPRNLEIYI